MKLEQKVYATTAEKRLDFIIGLAGFFAVNLLFAGAAWGLAALSDAWSSAGNPSAASTLSTVVAIVGCLPFLINIGGLVFLAFTRPWVSLGILSGYALLLLITVCAAIAFGIYCFTSSPFP